MLEAGCSARTHTQRPAGWRASVMAVKLDSEFELYP